MDDTRATATAGARATDGARPGAAQSAHGAQPAGGARATDGARPGAAQSAHGAQPAGGARAIADEREAAQELERLFATHEHAVFFGGAGVSTASGILDFRSADGLYHQHFAYPPETMLSHSFYETHPAEFFAFYRERMIALGAQPNQCHRKLAELEREGHLDAVVTQNIDGLHQAAGSGRVYELHGSVHRNICQRCGAIYTAEQMVSRELEDADGIPRCPACGGRIKPDVVLYEEALDQEVLEGAMRAIMRADLLVVGGTSLVVYPAAGLIGYFQGDALVIVNRDPTPQDAQADMLISCDIAQAFSF